ncbi:glycine, alanine and asparagine-rich protein-like isoform X4 [Mytilus trossulus]|uniref:glycine, alanine and asparagine-rich protein-like isoform X4 n=1 Tax=Mytilus trossulus TaxID=6551 RepID=UPI0030053872
MKIWITPVLTLVYVALVTCQNAGNNFGNFGGTGMNMGTNSGPTFGNTQTFPTGLNTMGANQNSMASMNQNSFGMPQNSFANSLGTATSLTSNPSLTVGSGGSLTPDQRFLSVARLQPTGPARPSAAGPGAAPNAGGGFQSFDPFSNQAGQGPPGAGGFTNQGQDFTNQGQGFTNQGQGFTNQGQGFQNQGQGFQNQGQGFTNQGFGNQGGNQGNGFGNQGGNNQNSFGLGDGADFFNDNNVQNLQQNNNNNNQPFGQQGGQFGAMGGFARGPMMGGPLFAGSPFQTVGGFSDFGGGSGFASPFSPFGGNMGTSFDQFSSPFGGSSFFAGAPSFGGMGGGLPGFGGSSFGDGFGGSGFGGGFGGSGFGGGPIFLDGGGMFGKK